MKRKKTLINIFISVDVCVFECSLACLTAHEHDFRVHRRTHVCNADHTLDANNVPYFICRAERTQKMHAPH